MPQLGHDEQSQSSAPLPIATDIRPLLKVLVQTSDSPASYFHHLLDDVAGQRTLIAEVDAGASPEHIRSSVASTNTLELLFREHHLPRIRDVLLGHAVARLRDLLGDDLVDNRKLSAQAPKLAHLAQKLRSNHQPSAPRAPKLPMDALIAHIEHSRKYGDMAGDPDWEDDATIKNRDKHTWRGRLEAAIERRHKVLDSSNRTAPWHDFYWAIDDLIDQKDSASLLSACREAVSSAPGQLATPVGPETADTSLPKDFVDSLEACGASLRRTLMEKLVAASRGAADSRPLLQAALLCRSRVLASDEAMLVVKSLEGLAEAEQVAGNTASATKHCDAAVAILAAFRAGRCQPDTFALINADPHAVQDVMKGVQPQPKRCSKAPQVCQTDVDEARERLLKRKVSLGKPASGTTD